jgi:hypothetical protein
MPRSRRRQHERHGHRPPQLRPRHGPLGVPPFRHKIENGFLWPLACDLRQAAVADNASALAIRTTRLQRLWKIEDWLLFHRRQHPRIARWLHQQLVAIGWRKQRPVQDETGICASGRNGTQVLSQFSQVGIK